MTQPRPPIHLAVAFPALVHASADLSAAPPTSSGAGAPTAALRARDLVDFRTYVQFAQTAQRGGFDFLLLGEDLRLPAADEVATPGDPDTEQAGAAGRPDPLTLLAALASVTDGLGLAATATTTFGEPYAVARRLATLDHLSGGRAAWNVVTTLDERAGANFRHGPGLLGVDRAERTREFLAAAASLFGSWADEDLVVDPAAGTFLADPRAGSFTYRGRHFDIDGRFNVPRSPQGRPPVLLAAAAGDGEDARRQRDLAAAVADVVITPYAGLDAGIAFRADLHERLALHGRVPGELLVLPAVSFVLGAGAAGAAAADGSAGGTFAFVGAAETIARDIAGDVWAGAADGFLLVPPVRLAGADGTGGGAAAGLLDGLTQFVDSVAPALRAAGALRADPAGTTLRARLGLPPVPSGGARGPAAALAREVTAGAATA
ncbi:LLM class flavin-dependent oxidoreductase [Frankia sp. Mgl5]|uniref:LLM class flavin-dependent oxidoreductase n=1 Tax=Frankia sp. Mgl5 TaxID=2933793 RepID=UPI00200C5E5B|nr:LLM class flavin-dependent oxidoreductase [Frankia sp. Mgl5]MCK9926350.1 LLM class flavin-dependent oxidoreductase [Frankia sp. Mgl5]